jgi:intradiol ring-cleaving dioxygenase-like protein
MHAAGEPGMPLTVSGSVYSITGEIVPNAKLKIWQADHFGKYDLQGYKFRATMQPDSKAGYGFESVMPGHYPARVCQHIHYLVTAPGHKPLTTQLYFGTDPVFEGVPEYGPDPIGYLMYDDTGHMCVTLANHPSPRIGGMAALHRIRPGPRFLLEGDSLILSSEEARPGGERQRYRITWQRKNRHATEHEASAIGRYT